MIRGYARANSYHRQRLKYFFLAIGLSFLLGGGLNFLLLLGLNSYPLGNIAAGIGLLFMSYSIVQHRLVDVSVFMAKGLSYILSLIILAIPSFFVVSLLESFFHQRVEVSFVLILILIGTAAILLFQVIIKRMDEAMLQIIVRDKYKYHEILNEFGQRLVTIVDLNRLLQMLADTIENSMGVKTISVFLHDPEKEIYRVALQRGFADVEPMKANNPGVQYLQGKKEAILRPELGNASQGSMGEELSKIMVRLQAEICLPLIYMNRLIGFINLGSKAAKEMYYSEDLNLLNSLANQVAIAIENANLYENLKRSQGIMRRADRLASLGTLIASLAHEIRNPLVSIKTFTQLLPERIDDEEFRNYFLRVASGEIDRLTGLINELLGFARPSEPRPQGEDINTLIDKMEVLVSTEARKKNVTLSKKYASDLPQVKVDAEQIKQVLLNILLNALQAIKGEGQIWIETRLVQVPMEEKSEGFIQVEIRDSGVGIPKENLERIFDPFFSTRPDGSGLGLAISHGIIHEHGGFISVESQVGEGTSFKVHLPLKQGGKDGAQN
jgi:signal transduction histidine kinase